MLGMEARDSSIAQMSIAYWAGKKSSRALGRKVAVEEAGAPVGNLIWPQQKPVMSFAANSAVVLNSFLFSTQRLDGPNNGRPDEDAY